MIPKPYFFSFILIPFAVSYFEKLKDDDDSATDDITQVSLN